MVGYTTRYPSVSDLHSSEKIHWESPPGTIRDGFGMDKSVPGHQGPLLTPIFPPLRIHLFSSTGIFVVWNQLYISLPHTSNRYHGNFVHVSMAILMGNDGPLPLGSREIPTSCRFASTNDGTKNGTSISTSSTSVYYSNTWWRTSHGSFLWVITPVIYMG